MNRVGTNPELKELPLCSQGLVDGGCLQSGLEKDSFMDLGCPVVKVKLRGTDKTVKTHWSVNTLKTIARRLFLRHLFDSLPCLFVLIGPSRCRDFRE